MVPPDLFSVSTANHHLHILCNDVNASVKTSSCKKSITTSKKSYFCLLSQRNKQIVFLFAKSEKQANLEVKQLHSMMSKWQIPPFNFVEIHLKMFKYERFFSKTFVFDKFTYL